MQIVTTKPIDPFGEIYMASCPYCGEQHNTQYNTNRVMECKKCKGNFRVYPMC